MDVTATSSRFNASSNEFVSNTNDTRNATHRPARRRRNVSKYPTQAPSAVNASHNSSTKDQEKFKNEKNTDKQSVQSRNRASRRRNRKSQATSTTDRMVSGTSATATDSVGSSVQPKEEGKSENGNNKSKAKNRVRKQHRNNAKSQNHSQKFGSKSNRPPSRSKSDSTATSSKPMMNSSAKNTTHHKHVVDEKIVAGTARPDEIAEELTSGEYECLICTDTIGRDQAMWNCSKCYRILHLDCLKEWREKCEAQKRGDPWSCPSCRHVFMYQPRYLCFCGKENNPDINHYLVPHSCGLPCGRKRGYGCSHPCQLPCHPGPCPPCTAWGKKKKCGCGKTEYTVRCGEPDPRHTCSNICNKLLNCKLHRCAKVCHFGACESCTETVECTCYCSKSTRTLKCGQQQRIKRSKFIQQKLKSKGVNAAEARFGFFACDQICDALLDCKNHRCQERCHGRDCMGCQLTPARASKCPCSKTSLSIYPENEPLPALVSVDDTVFTTDIVPLRDRKSCLEPLPTCQSQCSKSLSCGHTCEFKCHNGICPSCSKEVRIACPCGSETYVAKCGEVITLGQTYVRLRLLIPMNEDIANEMKRLREWSFDTQQSDIEHSSSTSPNHSISIDVVVTMLDLRLACMSKCGQNLACSRHRCELICCPTKGAAREASRQQQNSATASMTRALFGTSSDTSSRSGPSLRALRRSARNSQVEPSANAEEHDTQNYNVNATIHHGSAALSNLSYLMLAVGLPSRQLPDLVKAMCNPKDFRMATFSFGTGANRSIFVRRVELDDNNHDVLPALDSRTIQGNAAAKSSQQLKRQDYVHQGPDHLCVNICARQLSCGKHTCPDFCHRGDCAPCAVLRYDPLSCDCGHTVVQPPVRCGQAVPECNQPCQKTRSCGHPHPLSHTCHPGPCPPCTYPVQRRCAGGHSVIPNVQCHISVVTCSRPCGKLLPCKQHYCKRQCHEGVCCDNPSEVAIHGCNQVCGQPRSRCSHGCMAQCHLDTKCQDVRCHESTQLFCECGRLQCTTQCLHGGGGGIFVAAAKLKDIIVELHRAGGVSNESLTANTLQHVPNSASDILIRVPASEETWNFVLRTRCLPCDDFCASAARARAFGEAVGAISSQRKSASDGQTSSLGFCPFPDAIVRFAESQRVWALKIDTQLRVLVTKAASGEQSQVTNQQDSIINFPAMKESQRSFIHQLAEVYGVTTASHGREPKRFVRASLAPRFALSTSSLNEAIGLKAVVQMVAGDTTVLASLESVAEAVFAVASALYTEDGVNVPTASIGSTVTGGLRVLPVMSLGQALKLYGSASKDAIKASISTSTNHSVPLHPMEPQVEDMKDADIGTTLCIDRIRPKTTGRTIDEWIDAADLRRGPSGTMPWWKRLDDAHVLLIFPSKGLASRGKNALERAISSGRIDIPSYTQIRWWGAGVADVMGDTFTMNSHGLNKGNMTNRLSGQQVVKQDHGSLHDRIGASSNTVISSNSSSNPSSNSSSITNKNTGSWSTIARQAPKVQSKPILTTSNPTISDTNEIAFSRNRTDHSSGAWDM